MENRSIALLFAAVTSAGLFASCATTAEQVHKWGFNGQYERIRATLSEQPAENVRIAAASELGKGDYAFGIPDLVTLSHDPSYKVRAAAVTGLSQYAGADVYNAILQRAGDENTEVARAAEQALRNWSEESTPFLIEATEDRNYKVRAAAITILGRMNDRSIPAILEKHASRDDNNIVRREAVRAIGTKGLKSSRALLYKIKQTDTSTEVSLAAEEALSKIGGNILDITTLIVPFQVSDNYLQKHVATVGNTISQKLVSNHLCEAKTITTAIEGDLTSALINIGKAQGVEQAIGGRISQENGNLTIDIVRVNVAKGTVIQQESYTNLASNPNQVIQETVKRLINRFI